MTEPTRRAFLSMLAASAAAPSALASDRPACNPPRYLGWTGRRERQWPDRIGNDGFVNYYGEAFRFDGAITVPRDVVPSCLVWGAERSTLERHGPPRNHLQALTLDSGPASTDCQRWPSQNSEDLDARIATLFANLRSTCPNPSHPAPVRFVAVGAHHSSSDVYQRADDTHTVVVRIDGLNQIQTARPEWREDRVGTAPHALVGAGIIVCHLNEALWERGLALETQGTFDGQSLAGAISTGTHGSGAQHGAIADSVEAVVVATCLRDPDTGAARWEVLQVEPDPGAAISDPARFPSERAGVRWRLVQSTALFEALLVPMGTMGVILAYVVRLRSAYFLRELRVGRPWGEVRENLVERAVTPTTGFTDNGWRYELVVNPNRAADSPDWVCTEAYRDAWDYDLDYLSELREVPDKWLGGLTRTVNLGGALSRTIVKSADIGLSKGRRLGWFADRCYRVMKLGEGEYVQAWGTEMMVPADRAVEMVDWVLRENPTRGEFKRGRRRNARLLNPFGVRFCRGRRGFLSPTRRLDANEPGLTCTMELTEAVKNHDTRNLGVRDNGKPSSKDVIESWAEDFVREFGSDGRLHWGQIQGEFGEAALGSCYPESDVTAWYQAFRVLNPFGLFDNQFAKRLGFVARRDADTSEPLRAL